MSGDGGGDKIDGILAEREGDYGSPHVNFQRIADMWTGVFRSRLAPGQAFTARDVAIAMIAVKSARLFHKYTQDSVDDIIGYARCAAEVETGEFK